MIGGQSRLSCEKCVDLCGPNKKCGRDLKCQAGEFLIRSRNNVSMKAKTSGCAVSSHKAVSHLELLSAATSMGLHCKV